MAEQLRIDERDWKNWLQIKPSIIPGAGRGVFACKDIAAKSVLGNYHGRHISNLRDVYELRDDQYVFATSSPDRHALWIDGNVRSNYLRFVNGAKTRAEQKCVNVETYQYGGDLRFRATRPIHAGEELILDYGAGYWQTYSNADGIKHRNDALLYELAKELDNCTDTRVRAVLRGMAWLLRKMSSVGAYYSFFVGYLWMFYEFRLSKCNPAVVDIATKVLELELDGAQLRLEKMFKPSLEEKWRFISLIPILSAVRADAQEYAKFYRSFFPRSLKHCDVTFNEHMQFADFEGMIEVLMDYCFIEMARHDNRHLRLFRLPGSRFSQYWRVIRRYDVRVLESCVTNDDEQFELDYQITHLVMCRLGYGSRVLARATKFDSQLTAYLVRHETRILDDSDDLDLIAELAYCYLVWNTQESWVKKSIDRILVTQNANGAWGTKEEMHLDMYDRMHATWTAVTALCHSLSKQAS
ncbi:MAG: SET domain-containing protein-lysine N-methyltransferase [Proteobacteria bacterium]|nr:SET domain-containing protein-lysine N-methyltransferase [Pseudomonadota bacterium]